MFIYIFWYTQQTGNIKYTAAEEDGEGEEQCDVNGEVPPIKVGRHISETVNIPIF